MQPEAALSTSQVFWKSRTTQTCLQPTNLNWRILTLLTISLYVSKAAVVSRESWTSQRHRLHTINYCRPAFSQYFPYELAASELACLPRYRKKYPELRSVVRPLVRAGWVRLWNRRNLRTLLFITWDLSWPLRRLWLVTYTAVFGASLITTSRTASASTRWHFAFGAIRICSV